MKNSASIILLVVITLYSAGHCFAQKDKLPPPDNDLPKVVKISIPVKAAKFQSDEIKKARADYMAIAKNDKPSLFAISSLKKKGHSNTAILATVRLLKLPAGIFNVVDNTEVAEDVQLMLKAIPLMTAAEMIPAIRELYDVSLNKLFDIAALTMQDSTRTVTEPKSFSYKCDCTIRNPQDVNSARPYRKSASQNVTATSYSQKLYPWECFDYWNTGFRSVVLPGTNLNEFLRFMRISQYPLFGGMRTTDLADPAIDFTVIMGNTAASLDEIMDCATLSYLPPGNLECHTEVPSYPINFNYSDDPKYRGNCKHIYYFKTRFNLKELLTVLKANGFSATILATAVKTRFNPTDDDLKQKIIASFDGTGFSAAEILQAANVINGN